MQSLRFPCAFQKRKRKGINTRGRGVSSRGKKIEGRIFLEERGARLRMATPCLHSRRCVSLGTRVVASGFLYRGGRERRRSVSMRQVCMGIRERGREEERFARKFVTLGWNILKSQVLKFREVRLGYGLETVCWTFFSREEMTYEIIIFLWSLWELHRNVNINLLYSTYKLGLIYELQTFFEIASN